MRNIIYFILSLLFSFIGYALETINIEHGQADPTPIAVNKFNADSSTDNVVGRHDVVKVISNDLKLSGLFRPISSASFIEEKTGIDYKPLFATWRQINASLLVNGEVKKLESGKLKISFILWDTLLEKQLAGEILEVPENLWRRAAHKIADKIYEKITGDAGYFDTKIVYVSESSSLPKIKRIALMDYDGANNKYLTNGKSLVLTPRFAHSADKIFYVSYATKRRALVYEKDLKTGKESVVGDFSGISFAPRFSPDGRKALMSIAKNGSTHIYEIDLATKRLHKLTDGFGINTSPSYSPDGKKIVYNSDRNGVPQLYIMNSDGSDVQRISFGGGSYTAPSWSPRGDYIAFTKITRGDGGKTFNIGIMKACPQDDENSERIITSGYLVESPCWSPNGRVIMFAKGWPSRAKATGKNKIFTIDLTGHNEREIMTPADASDPEWSGVLH